MSTPDHIELCERAMRYATTLMLIWILTALQMHANGEEDVLYIGHLDDDEHADTVLGRPSGDLRMLATAIHWGTPYSSTGGEAPRTLLRYPQWQDLAGSFAIEDVDDDRTDDLVLFFNSPNAPDSARALAILGRRTLRSVGTVDLREHPRSLQPAPFAAVDLTAMGALTDRAERDHSGRPSHRLRRVPIAMPDSSERSNVPATLAEIIALYPNPASALATFESGRLGPGEYEVDVVDIEGVRHLERRLRLDRDQPLKGTLDLSDLPPGLYLVRIRSAGALVASYPVVIVR